MPPQAQPPPSASRVGARKGDAVEPLRIKFENLIDSIDQKVITLLKVDELSINEKSGRKYIRFT